METINLTYNKEAQGNPLGVLVAMGVGIGIAVVIITIMSVVSLQTYGAVRTTIDQNITAQYNPLLQDTNYAAFKNITFTTIGQGFSAYGTYGNFIPIIVIVSVAAVVLGLLGNFGGVGGGQAQGL